MLKCHLDKDKNIGMVEANGSTLDIIVDLTHLINDVYNALRSDDELTAAVFKEVFQKTVAADDSPVWGNLGPVDGVTSVTYQFPKGFRPGAED